MSVVDFDAAWQEQAEEAFTWRVHGDIEVTMPGSRPAALVLHLWRVRDQRGDDADLSYEELRVAALMLFGPAALGQMLEDRFFGEDKLADAVTAVLAEYAEREARVRAAVADDAPGKAASPSGGRGT